mgnify:FL=1
MNIKFRKFYLKDISTKYINWLKNEELTKYTEINNPSKKEVNKYVKLNIEDKKVNFLRIIFKNKTHIGNLRIKYLSKNEVTIAILIGDQRYKNKGLGTQSIKLAIKMLKKRGNKTIFAYINKKNIPSVKIFKKNGFTKLKNKSDLYYLSIK